MDPLMHKKYSDLKKKQQRMTRISIILIAIQVIVSTAIVVYFATQGV